MANRILKSSKKRGNNATKKSNIKYVSETVQPSSMTLKEWQVALRRQAALKQTFVIEAIDAKHAPGEFRVKNSRTRRAYKVVYRGNDSQWNYCSCLDFKTSRLGTCKHLESVKMWLSDNNKSVRRDNLPSYTSVYLSYRGERKVKIRIGEECREQFKSLAERYFDNNGVLRKDCCELFPDFLDSAMRISSTFRCYDDALSHVIDMRESAKRESIVNSMSDDELDHLLHTKLFPYQKEGVKFAFVKGRSLIADEMGLGKTVQAIGAAELLRRHKFVESILVVCPTSLKYQWKSEIERFTGADVMIVEGVVTKRALMYNEPTTYKIVSYHTMANDVRYLGHIDADMVIMDEVQRLKNWNTIIATAARRIDARYTVALSGTPLENKLEEFYSVMELVDQYCLGPYYEFRDKYIVTDSTAKVISYKNLNDIGKKASERLIRRRKADVAIQLPPRQDTTILVAVTQQQMDIHTENKEIVARLISKWHRQHFLSENDRCRLLLCLNIMRMVSDSTYILDQTTRHDVKIGEAMDIIDQMIQSGNGKAVVFSQWERMARLLAQELDQRGVGYEFLHGGVPSHKRGAITERFKNDAECRVFLSTDAGSTGLNLQSASLIINLDLPWNPAVLEQRIGRIYRYGQKDNVQVINLVSKGTIEESMIVKLKFKQNMFSGVLDNGEDTIFADDGRFKQIIDVFDGLVEDNSTVTPTTDSSEELPVQPQSRTATTTIDDDYYDEDDISDGYYDCIDDFIYDDEDEVDDENVVDDEDEVDEENVEDKEDPDPGLLDKTDHGTTDTDDDAKQNHSSDTTITPQDLMAQGVSFFSGLAQTLKSPEATKQLIDSIVKTDPQSGRTSLNIPVPSKEAVEQILNIFSKFFQSTK